MRRPFPTAPMLIGLVGAALLGGCGGGTKTVSVASAPPVQSTGATTKQPTRTGSTASTPATTSTSTTPTTTSGVPGPTTTRTAPAPAFTHQSSGAAGSAEGLSGAEAVLQAKGFSASATSDYHPNQTLRVLVGTRTGSGEGNGQQAFFFVGGQYIGTDAKQPSASIHVVSQSDTEVTLAYALSGAGGSGGAGGAGGHATVRFQLNDGKLTPLNQIPSASSRQ